MTQEQRKKIETTFYIIGWGIFAVIWILWILQIQFGFQISDYQSPCIFHAVTGIFCAGCGGTRAVSALLEGKILASFLYHPLVPYGAAVVVWFMISHTIEKLSRGKLKTGMHYRNAYLWIALILLILNTVVKNAALLIWHIDLFQIIGRS